MAKGIPKAPNGLQSTPRITNRRIFKTTKNTCQHNRQQVSHSSNSSSTSLDDRFFRENRMTETAKNTINIKTTTSNIGPILDSILIPRLHKTAYFQ